MLVYRFGDRFDLVTVSLHVLTAAIQPMQVVLSISDILKVANQHYCHAVKVKRISLFVCSHRISFFAIIILTAQDSAICDASFEFNACIDLIHLSLLSPFADSLLSEDSFFTGHDAVSNANIVGARLFLTSV